MRVLLAALVIAFSPAAWAAPGCGAKTFTKFDETRAYFRDVWASCAPSGACRVVSATEANDGAAFAHRFTIGRDAPGAALSFDLAATSPMPATPSAPQAITIGRTVEEIAVQAVAGNEFRLSDPAQADRILARAKRGVKLAWTYPAAGGPATGEFGLRGLTAALKWVDCMGGKTGAAAAPDLSKRAPLNFTPEPDKGANAKLFSKSLAARYKGVDDAAVIVADMRAQGLDCTPPAGAAGVTECQRVQEVQNTACFDVWRASHDIDDKPPLQGDYARRCLGALPGR
jgi:hypothetical protein